MSGAGNDGAATTSTQPCHEDNRHRQRTRHRKSKNNDNANPSNITEAGESQTGERAPPVRNAAGRHRRPKQQQQQQQEQQRKQKQKQQEQTEQTQQAHSQSHQTQSHEGSTSQQASSQKQPTQRQPPRNHGNTRRRNRPRKDRGRDENRESQQDGENASNLIKRSVAGPGRTFGAGLTQSRDDFSQSQSSGVQDSLRADVPDFIPGQSSHAQRADAAASVAGPALSKQKGKRIQRGGKFKATGEPLASVPKITEKSTADDITTRIHEDIAHNLYECPVCTSEIGKRSKVWSCTHCWTVFHLACIKKWAGNEGSAVARPRGEDGDQTRQWRCPGCNLPHEITPAAYSCWCEKETDPRSLPGLPPHSCGQTCSKSRQGCPHPCDSVCHAGPCPPCSAMGPTQSCFCGRHESTKKCVDTDYVNGWSCGEVCGEYMPCMNHTCTRRCHEGLCGACEESVDARCYCGKVTTTMLCSAQGEEEESQRYNDEQEPDEDDMDEWTGTFACKDICGRLFDCGKHICEKPCHPQDADTPHCPKAPDMITHCPCGKTRLSDIEGFVPRQSCEDPFPRCTKPCGKSLPCGHSCPMPCHSGSCNPCFQVVVVKCRCGRSDFKTICHQGINEPPQCMRVCKATLNCGRHACMERCCPGERKSIERLATKRKLRSLQSASAAIDDVEAEHVCTRVCGRPLKCGNHTCPELCHKGVCASCREAIFDEIACNCGRTIAYPPLPCGTKPPACPHECRRPKSCGHPQTSHNCHTDEESCPKCPFLMDKRCMCGKKVMKNQPCYLVSPRCGLICNEELKCGNHTCKKTCHAPEDCEDANQPCQQACGKTKKLCPHTCTEKCHAPQPCPERPCETKMELVCQCGRLKEFKRCGMSLEKARAGAEFVQPRLICDEECARLERNRTLASALNVKIDPTTTNATGNGEITSSITASTVPYSDETLDRYLSVASSATLSTLQTYEQKLHDLAHSDTKRSTRFTPARASLRAFIHSLATDWGFVSESFDPEPHRYVEVYKSLKWLPPAPLSHQDEPVVAIGIAGISVAEGIRMRDRELAQEREMKRAAAAAAAASKAKVTETATLNESAAGGASAGSSIGGVGGSGGGSGSSSGGWAQVARKKAGTADSPPSFSMPKLTPGGPSFGKGRFGALVLKSSVGRGKGLEDTKISAKKDSGVKKTEVADDWEQEVDAEESNNN